METFWQPIAQRIVEGLGVAPGELIEVRDSAGRLDALLEILLAIECAGATPQPQITPAAYLQRLWSAAPRSYLADWDRHRQEWARQFDRVLVLGGIPADFGASDEAAFAVWQQAVHRLSAIEEARGLPVLVVALPTEARAAQLGMSLAALEQLVLPALTVSGSQSLNVDYAIPAATLIADGRVIVAAGKLVV